MQYGNEYWQREIARLEEQIRSLKTTAVKQADDLTQLRKDFDDAVATSLSPPGFINHVNNGDFGFNESGYNGASYGGASDDAAQWYARTNSTATAIVENTTTVQSADSLRNNAALSSYWDKASGIAVMGGNKGFYHPLVKNIAIPGAVIYVRFQIKHSDAADPIPNGYKIQASFWDNTAGQLKTIEGAVWDVVATPAVPTPGAFTRQYILKVDSTSGVFYSDVIGPATVNNQVSVSSIDNTNFVNVSWMSFPESRSYTLYRFDNEFNEWRQIAFITNGALQFQDKGGRDGALFIPPGSNVNAKAQVRIDNFNLYISDVSFSNLIFAIRVPSNYDYSLTTSKQWLRIDILDSSDAYATVDDRALFIDKVAVGYNNGTWTMSAKDMNSNATIVTTTPPPTNMPGGDDPLPSPGGGRPLFELQQAQI